MPNRPAIDWGVVKIFEVCRELEEEFAALYGYFAELYVADRELAALWGKTSREETGHAGQFALARRLVEQRALEVSGLRTDLYGAQNALTMVRNIHAGVRRSPPPLADALRAAVKLEHRLAGLHADLLAEFSEPAQQKLFQAMMAADQRHVEALEAARARLLARRS